MRAVPIRGFVDQVKKRRSVLDAIKRVPHLLRSLPRTVWQRVLWSVDPRRRKVYGLVTQLEQLPGGAKPMQHLRREVYTRSLLEIKNHEIRQEMPLIVRQMGKPLGPEQIFFFGIYPLLVNRRLIAVPRASGDDQLDLEIGYRGHADEYYFWVLEIDGKEQNRADRTPTPRVRQREDRVYLVYPVPAAGLVDIKQVDPDATIIRVRSYFLNILNDAKRRGYQLLTARPHTHEALTYNQRKAANSRVPSPFAPKRSSRR